MHILVVDVGGSRVKLFATGQTEPRKFDSGTTFTPADLVAGVKAHTADWPFDVVSLGVPAVVGPDGLLGGPGNLGPGWAGFDFAAAFGKPVRYANDAAMQALGAYDGGRMLFLGLGTGLGSALVVERVVIPLELGNLRAGRKTLFERLGKAGRRKYGDKVWQRAVTKVTAVFRQAFVADYVVLGGGNAKHVDPLPPGVRRGGNAEAFAGGFRLWEEDVEPHDCPPSRRWRVVR